MQSLEELKSLLDEHDRLTDGNKLPLPAEIERQRKLLRAILAAYDKTKDEEQARIPTILAVAIEAARC